MPTTTIDAIFDGQAFQPDHPIELKPNTRVRITIELVDVAASPQSFLRTARSLRLDAPADLASNIDLYLYGETPDASA